MFFLKEIKIKFRPLKKLKEIKGNVSQILILVGPMRML
jgi:hypothetical protein